MSNALKITTDNVVKAIEIDFDQWEQIKDALDGYFTIVRTKNIWETFGPDAVMLVDDDGYQKELKANLVGSLMYAPGMIVGDIIICRESCAELVGFDETDVAYLYAVCVERFKCRKG